MQRHAKPLARLASFDDWRAFAPLTLETLSQMLDGASERQASMYGEEHDIESDLNKMLRREAQHWTNES